MLIIDVWLSSKYAIGVLLSTRSRRFHQVFYRRTGNFLKFKKKHMRRCPCFIDAADCWLSALLKKGSIIVFLPANFAKYAEHCREITSD